LYPVIYLATLQHGGAAVPTYESASTQAFLGGRTETIRSATAPSRAFVEAAAADLAAAAAAAAAAASGGGGAGGGAAAAEAAAAAALHSACAAHGKIAGEAASGRGFDRHLFALRAIAADGANNGGGGGGGTPVALFEDPAYARLMTNILSTSHLTRPSIEVNGFGAVHEEGYGIAYNIHGGHVRAAVSTYLGTGAPFHAAMERALGYVGALLERLAEEKKKKEQKQVK
jgi:hypothetical protein